MVLRSYRYPDIVLYLLHATSLVTLEEVKNYKSLQRFRYFTSVFMGLLSRIEEVQGKRYLIVLVLGKVRHNYFSTKTPSTLGPDSLHWNC